MSENCLLTVFTPAYNRAHTLPRTYESLCKQSRKDFVWLIVDDGSRDNTRELVEEWQRRDNGFKIRYIYKENGGMHTAHNEAYRNIDTVLNVCIDSDDFLAEGAVEKIYAKWEEFKDDGYAGIIGLDADTNGEVVGAGFSAEMRETTLTGYYASGGKGDKKLIYRTDVIKSVPAYPVFKGEKYTGLSYKYIVVAQQYKLFVLNEVVCNVEYQEDGSSNTMYLQYLKNPNGFAFMRRVNLMYPTSKKRLLMECIHYCSSSQIAHNRNYIKESPRKALTILCTPLGWCLPAYIRRKARMER